MQCKWQRIAQGLLIAAAGFVAASLRAPAPLPAEGSYGSGYLQFHSVAPQQGPFNHSLACKATFIDAHARTTPCTLYFKPNEERPPARCDYLICGTLKPTDRGMIQFKPERTAPWIPVEGSWSSAEWRYLAKESLRRYFKQLFPDTHARHFLAAMATGDIDDRLLSMEFNKVGLSHILAISGFNFVLIAAVLGALLRSFLPFKLTYLLLFLLLSGYLLFLGLNPSILRAYVAISFYLLARFVGLRPTALDLLGLGIIVELVYNPLYVQDLGFQLTFLCTLGLLLFSAPLGKLLSFLLPRRPVSEIAHMSLVDKHGTLLCGLIRSSLATNLSAHLLALPLCLYVFHSFPLLSLVYNLFFPFCLSISLLLLILGLMLGPFGLPIHALNSTFTAYILEIIGNPPALLNIQLQLPDFPFPLLIAILSILALTKSAQGGKIEYFLRGGRSSAG